MSRKLLIFGNGLGMALDPQHFLLSDALEVIWNNSNVLNANQRQLILRCTGRHQAPQGEDELDKLHLAINACKTLDRIGDGNVHWLTDDGQAFPSTTATYLHKVATHLHNYEGELPQDFMQPLLEFIRETKSHVATLNYDKLLYGPFIDSNIVGRYDIASLIDGMTDTGLSSDSLERKYGNDFGYYLHLHGSPLFMGSGSTSSKLQRHQLTLNSGTGQHIVLSHIDHKPSVIAASYILRTYWDYLRFALSEVDEIILFGYSGLDKHLNELIKPYLKARSCRVVEWAGSEGDRRSFWQNVLGTRLQKNYIPMDNILDFVNW
ncbi:hypothetical protein [Endozoicomonas sp. ALC020]|uniref:hypothetical protein n=1 Tax=unclassified Endozoicomonas TaxID=2644528 RepID=UPI003BAF9C96